MSRQDEISAEDRKCVEINGQCVQRVLLCSAGLPFSPMFKIIVFLPFFAGVCKGRCAACGIAGAGHKMKHLHAPLNVAPWASANG